MSIGRSVTILLDSEVPISALPFASMLASAVTVTASATPPTTSVWSRVITSPRCSSMPSCVKGVNLGIEKLTT